jgi:hypothetical protein
MISPEKLAYAGQLLAVSDKTIRSIAALVGVSAPPSTKVLPELTSVR